MINKIIASTFFVLLLLSLSLALFGVEHVDLGPSFMAFLRTSNDELNNYKIAIPDIPVIPSLPAEISDGEWFDIFVKILNVIVTIFNGIRTIINILISIINVLIQLIEFVVIMIKNIITLRDTLVSSA